MVSIAKARLSSATAVLWLFAFSLPIAARGQALIWPGAYRDSAFVQEHFSTDSLHARLERDFNELLAQLQEVASPLEAYPESKKLEVFQWSKYPWRLSEKQIGEFKRSGKVKLREFGWPKLEDAMVRRRRWLDILKRQVAEFVKVHAPDTTQAGSTELLRLNKEKQRLSDAINNELFYVERTLKWDDYCRKGPWLLDPSLRRDLQKEIAALGKLIRSTPENRSLEDYFRAIRGDPLLADIVQQSHILDSIPTAQQLTAHLKILLKDKQTVYGHYYKFKKRAQGIALKRDSDGWLLEIRLALHGPGADDRVRKRIQETVEDRLHGASGGNLLRTRANITFRSENGVGQSEAIAIKIAAPGETVATESTLFHYEIEPSTIVHEIKHLIGFSETYRDIYDPVKRLYVTYLENISKHQKPDQEIELPDLSEGEIAQILENYR